MSECSKCGDDNRGPSGRCRTCRNAARRRAYSADPEKFLAKDRAYRRANPEVARESRRRRWARDRAAGRNQNLKRYGLDHEAFEQMLALQGGVCAICKSPEPGGKGKFHVDHCHSTDRVRGLLCNGCNIALGHMHDDPVRLREAALYLESIQ